MEKEIDMSKILPKKNQTYHQKLDSTNLSREDLKKHCTKREMIIAK